MRHLHRDTLHADLAPTSAPDPRPCTATLPPVLFARARVYEASCATARRRHATARADSKLRAVFATLSKRARHCVSALLILPRPHHTCAAISTLPQRLPATTTLKSNRGPNEKR